MSVTYRSDIDGIRALAVLLVVGFHAFPNYVPGGFIGVDIFFVVSGFLISRIILDGQERGNFSLTDFYARRIRRIFPALVVVIAACTIFGWCLLSPTDYALLGKSIAASAAFIYNFVLLHEQGYFDAVSELKPLLHLWSLGIEEQFYVVWPILMVLGMRKKAAPSAIAKIILLISFGINVVLTATNGPAAFYLPITRFWELMLGCILAISQFKHFGHLNANLRNAVEEAASWIGFSLIALAVILINQAKAFPGWWALMPTFGTALLIFAGDANWISRKLLKFPTLVYVGLISYPLYLWHWPILSFARLFRGSDPRPLAKIAYIVLAFVLANATYRFIEKPIRFGEAKRKSKTILVTIALAIVGIMGLVVHANDGLPSRFPAEIQNSIKDHSKAALAAYRSEVCFLSVDSIAQFGKECDESGISDRKKIVLWGDSLAAHLAPGLQQAAQDHGFNLIQYTAAACPPLFAFGSTAHLKKCSKLYDTVADKIGLLRPETVIMAGIWFAYYDTTDARLVDESIHRTVNRLKSMGVQRVVGIGQFPHWTAQPQVILSRIYSPFPRLLNRDPKELQENKAFIAWREFDTDKRLADVFSKAGASFVAPRSTLCNHDGCQLLVPGGNGVPMNWDSNHLTVAGSIYFVRTNEQDLLKD